MNCKNCNEALADTFQYCNNCGAKVVTERISAKGLIINFINDYFGWDNRFLRTIKTLILQPEVLCKEYLNGVRRKYVAPFTFLAIATALAMLVFNQFSEKYIELANMASDKQFELMEGQFDKLESVEEFQKQRKESLQLNTKIQSWILQYFNIFTFLMVPVYGFMAYLVYRKPFNYGEHLVIVSYLQGFVFLTSILFFIVGLLTHPALYYTNVLVAVFFYLFVYKRLYQETVKRTIWRLFKFVGIALLVFISLMLIGFIIGLLSQFIIHNT